MELFSTRLFRSAVESSLKREEHRMDSATDKKLLLRPIEFGPSVTLDRSHLNNLKEKYIVFKSHLKLTPSDGNNKKRVDPFETTEPIQIGVNKPVTAVAGPTTTVDTTTTEPVTVVKEEPRELFPMDQVILGWKKLANDWLTGCGLTNMGNSCYLNSTLQALFHVPSMVNWLIFDREGSSLHGLPDCACLICAMRKTLLDSQSQIVHSIRPHLIYSRLSKLSRSLVPGRQEDAHEFLRCLLEGMEKSFLERFKDNATFDCKLKETTPLNQIFGGYLRTSVRCLGCGNVSTTFQHFQDLLLDIRKAQSVDDAMDLYFTREKLDEESYHCGACHKKVQATKQFQLERPPNVLCIQLKRFSMCNNKLIKHVRFQKTLDMTKFVRQPLRTSLKYRLVSLITHLGSTLSCGHYTAIGQSPSGHYYCFDDHNVKPISIQNVLDTNPYILLYELEAPPLIEKPIQQTVKSKASSTVTASASSNTKVPNGTAIRQSNGPKKLTQMVFKSAPSMPLLMGFTSDEVYGPELPPVANGKRKLTSSTSSGRSDQSSSGEEEIAKKEADSSTGAMEISGDVSPSSVLSTSVSSLDKNGTSKRLVPYETSSSEEEQYEANRVHTKATLVGEWQVTSTTDIRPQNGQWVKKRSAENSKHNVVSELFKMSTSGYSAPVSTWGGNRSQLDKEVQQERREDRKRSADSSIDQGRAKHAKVSSSFNKGKTNPGYNPIQECHNMKNWSNSSGSSGYNHYHHNSKPYYHNRHKRNFHQGNRGSFHKSYRYR
ncbi:ubiquitin carboxyl-terminal hydrolase 36 [Dendroctonus ponderosae]|nr:ubiquitin carboxyl-terminal hydrolase 36 [Dendroctonus ponderosae]